MLRYSFKSSKKGLLLYIFTIIFCLFISTQVRATEEGEEIVPPPIGRPNLEYSGSQTFGISAGKSDYIILPFTNSGSGDARSISLQLVPEDGTAPLTFHQNYYGFYVQQGTSSSASIIVSASSTAPAKTYKVNVTYTYIGDDGVHTGNTTINITILNALPAAKLQFMSFGLSPETLSAGSPGVITAQISNTGGRAVKNASVSISGLSPDGITIRNGVAIKYIDIPGNSSASVSFELSVAAKMKTGNYPITYIVQWQDDDGKEIKSEQIFYASVVGTAIDDPQTASPNIRFVDDTMLIVATGTVKRPLAIKNTGNFNASNVIVQISPTDPTQELPFTMSLNNGYDLSHVWSPDEINYTMLTLNINPTAESKTYGVTLKYMYMNEYNANFTGEDKIYIKVDNKLVPSVLEFADFHMEPSAIMAGESAIVTCTLKNTGALAATNVNILLDGLATDGLTIKNGVSSVKFNTLAGNTTNEIKFEIAAAEQMKTGNYPITYKLSYTSSSKAESVSEQKYYINVKEKAAEEPEPESRVNITNVTGPSGAQNVGQDFKISFSLQNNSIGVAKKIKVTSVAPADGGVVPKSANTQIVEALEPNEIKQLDFLFAATEASKTQNYTICFTVEYLNGNILADKTEEKVTFEQYVGVNVSNPEPEKIDETEDKKSTPKIIVSKYVCSPIIVKAGEEFDLSMTYHNTNMERTVKNIKVFLTVTETNQTTGSSIFTPVNSSNTFYINEIQPNQTVDRTLRLYAIPDAQPKTYTINVNFEYEDNEGTEFKTTELVGINVAQPSKLDTGEMAVPGMLSVGQPFDIYFDFYNTGKVKISNLIIKVEGSFESQQKSMFFGNLESGASDYFSTMLTPMEPGEQTGKVIIAYDEPTGEHVEIVKDFSTVVQDAPAYDPMMDPMFQQSMEPPPAQGIMGIIKNMFFIGGAAGAIVVTVVVIILVRRNIKKKRENEMMLDE